MNARRADNRRGTFQIEGGISGKKGHTSDETLTTGYVGQCAYIGQHFDKTVQYE